MKVLKICSVWIHIHNSFERIMEYLLTLSGKNILCIFSRLDMYMSTYVHTSKMTTFQKCIFYFFGMVHLKKYILLMDVDIYIYSLQIIKKKSPSRFGVYWLHGPYTEPTSPQYR